MPAATTPSRLARPSGSRPATHRCRSALPVSAKRAAPSLCNPAEDGKTENVGTVIAFAAEPGKPALDGTGDSLADGYPQAFVGNGRR